MVEVPANTDSPLTERSLPGEVVPIPMRMPSASVLLATNRDGLLGLPTNRVVVAMRADEVVVPVIWALPPCTEKREPGEVVPSPTREVLATKSEGRFEVPTSRVVVATNADTVVVPVI